MLIIKTEKIFATDHFLVQHLPQMLNPLLLPINPVVLDYHIRLDKEYHHASDAYDVTIRLSEPLTSHFPLMMGLAASSTMGGSESAQLLKDITLSEDRITRVIQSIRNARSKRDFLLEFAQDPATFIQRWVASQTRDLETILGEDHINVEARRRSDFYQKDWVREAVLHYLNKKVA